MKKVSYVLLLGVGMAPVAARAAASCPTGYITVDMPDVEIAATCDAGYTSAGSIDDCSTGAGVCAVADTCGAGKYKDDSGTCQTCNIGYYCPGDDVQHYCTDLLGTSNSKLPYYSDTTGATECTKCPHDTNSEAKTGLTGYWYWSSGTAPDSDIHTTVAQCRVNWTFEVEHGHFTISCSYGESGYLGTVGTPQKCLISSGSYCDAGYYIDPTNSLITQHNSSGEYWAASYSDIVAAAKCVPVGPGYYSPAGTSMRTKCPAGTYSRGDTAADASECESLCTAGATQLHVGPHVFNLYPDSACASPAVHIGLDGGTCCAHLVKGEGTDAMHVRYNDTVYHTTN